MKETIIEKFVEKVTDGKANTATVFMKFFPHEDFYWK